MIWISASQFFAYLKIAVGPGAVKQAPWATAIFKSARLSYCDFYNGGVVILRYMRNIKVIIQAGGRGTRLHPVTLEIPKPLLTVKRRPILNHLLDFFISNGVRESYVVINHNHKEDFEWWKKRYKGELPKVLEFVVEPEPLGTFGGLKYISHKLNSKFILSNGDELKRFDLKDFVRAHEENKNKPLATIALVKVPNPSDYGVPVLKGDKVIEFLEKPVNPPSNFISSGLYILEPEIFDYADFSRGFVMIEKDIFPKLAADGKLAGYKAKNSAWYDCGTFPRWEKAIKEW